MGMGRGQYNGNGTGTVQWEWDGDKNCPRAAVYFAGDGSCQQSTIRHCLREKNYS